MEHGRNRVVIEAIKPQIDGGRYPIKRAIGDTLVVEADLFTDGHDAVSGLLQWRKESDSEWNQVALAPLGNDHWRASFPLTTLGRYRYTVCGWVDAFHTWARDLKKRIAANQDAEVDYRIGAKLILEAASRASGLDSASLRKMASTLETGSDVASRRSIATGEDLVQAMDRWPDLRFRNCHADELVVIVDPIRAVHGAWYEFFPRSTSTTPGLHGTFADCEDWLRYAAGMGFDIVYFPPIHPIGVNFRKGPNNSVTAGPEDTGSPWAIGGVEGGHKSIHPQLGSFDDFGRLVGHAKDLGLEIALDVAFQASPDHPYVQEHPSWFRARPDGTIQYAENPPKKYQDIYPFDFESEDYVQMWHELKSVFEFWIGHGVTIFRVDNPHTKAFPFWEWCISELKKKNPELIFLSEAFTRPRVMYGLAKAGFTQSYTYFPWRHTKAELQTYFTELTQTDVSEYFRGNHWPNTPDILTEFLQTTGRNGFALRFLLAATISANYGIYGPAFELMEHEPREHGSEEYRNSEKYQIRHWDRSRSDSLSDLITLVNKIRRENPALLNDRSLRFQQVDNDQLICYSKVSEDGASIILTVVNLDPHHRHSGFITLPLEEFGIDASMSYQLHELLTGARYIWNGPRNYVEIDPYSVPAQIFRLRRKVRTEREFEYFL